MLHTYLPLINDFIWDVIQIAVRSVNVVGDMVPLLVTFEDGTDVDGVDSISLSLIAKTSISNNKFAAMVSRSKTQWE